MSAENVELVRAAQPAADVDLVEFFGADERWAGAAGELGGLFHEDVEVRFVGGGKTTSGYGPEGFRSAWVDWLTPWESYRAEIQELVDRGDRVLVITDDYGRRPGMSVEVKLHGAAVWTIRDGKVGAVHFYLDRQAAFADLGMQGAG